MPFYDYHCNACNKDVEVLQKINDAPLTACPACGSHDIHKHITPANFRPKGDGWYETDFKQDGKKNLYHNDNSSSSSSG